MKNGKILISFSGTLDTVAVAKLTAMFKRYNINILDINMYNIGNIIDNLEITFHSSSTTDEIDSFWNDINNISNDLKLEYSKTYLE
jgi:hypothetical protein